jgi:hypothetical protein
VSTLAEVKSARDGFTKQLSDGVRQLAFAGIAVIWVLKTEPLKSGIAFDKFLYYPLGMFVLSLGCDLMHYLWASAVWDNAYRILSKTRELSDSADVPRGWTIPTRVFFWAKAIAAIIGYSLLFWFICTHLAVASRSAG